MDSNPVHQSEPCLFEYGPYQDTQRVVFWTPLNLFLELPIENPTRGVLVGTSESHLDYQLCSERVTLDHPKSKESWLLRVNALATRARR